MINRPVWLLVMSLAMVSLIAQAAIAQGNISRMTKEELKEFLCSEGAHNWQDAKKLDSEVSLKYGFSDIAWAGKRCAKASSSDPVPWSTNSLQVTSRTKQASKH